MGSTHPHVAWEAVGLEEGEADGGFKFVPLEKGGGDDDGAETEEKEMLV